MFVRIVQLRAVSVFLGLTSLVGCASLLESPETKAQKQSYRAFKAIALEEMGTYDHELRAVQIRTIDELAKRCHSLRSGKWLVSMPTDTFGDGPILSLTDRDGDQMADMYDYAEDRGADTQHFGFLFDLNQDGKMDWITFNQGVMIAEPTKLIWTSYHMIDTNYDGRADVFAMPDTDLDQDGRVEEGVYTWLQDSDFDGRLDRAEYVGAGVIEPIDCSQDVIEVKCILNKEIDVDSFAEFELGTAMLSDINELLAR